MNIQFDQTRRIFKLDTENTTYMIQIVDAEGFVGHLYYGSRLPDFNVPDLMHINDRPFTPEKSPRDRAMFMESFPFEYPTYGLGDFRESCLSVVDGDGRQVCGLTYKSHKIVLGKPPLEGLPATFALDDEAMTLELNCVDMVLGLSVTLLYTVFDGCDAVTRSARIKNLASAPFTLTRALSTCLDMDNNDFQLISFSGSWGCERHIQRQNLFIGHQGTSSMLGRTGHHAQPFVGLCTGDTTEDYGEVYAMHLVYSGNFTADTALSFTGSVRSVLGVNPDGFSWLLEPGGEFLTPEAVLVYSDGGVGQMSRTLHKLYRNHLIRGKYRDIKRPVLINNWEATYFDFDEEKLYSIAEQSAKLGIELLVMDDGWFGKRYNDQSSLGDWVVNEDKLHGGLKALVDRVNGLGMKFGIWFEPEMVSPDSDLYRAHPDWAFSFPGRTPSMARNQYVLDLTRLEVREYVWQSLSSVLRSANIEYVKWDMNRPLTDVGTYGSCLPGKIYHRYVLGMYELQNRLVTEFPDILFENCSSGGGRFDPGMLYYSPQIWTSDDTDAYERLEIQRGTAMLYPLSTMGAHVSDCPNHALGRTTPFETRGNVALAGTFGYELDVTRISQANREMIPAQVALYHKYNDLVRTGDYYRLSAIAETGNLDSWMVVSPDHSSALVTVVQGLASAAGGAKRLRLKGLDSASRYMVDESQEYSGKALMSAGLIITGLRGDFDSKLIDIKRI